ncbi:MAG: Hsp70 family protein, partial [Pirellulales bacterium]|nr:Hsp70 family protein [Pirellulales bacterium]
RNAKEALLSAGGPETQSISVLGRGSRLVGGTISVEVNRQAVQELLIEGFFPDCSPADRPARRRASGFREIGLPFEADTAVTRHLAAFLQAHGSGGQSVQPTRILFNGGVFKSDALQARLLDVVGSWFGGACPETLAGIQDLDFAVARGAAHYGWVKQKGGVRIRGGTARSYYVGIETAGPAIPGAPRPMKALCVVPIGMEEGTEADVPGEEIGLVVGESARFRFFSSSTRRQDRPGDLLDEWDAQEIEETDSMETELPAGVETEEDCVPVRFHSRVTELGMLELWCVGTAIPGRWKLEFSVREDAET